jgi:hypothetical protein
MSWISVSAIENERLVGHRLMPFLRHLDRIDTAVGSWRRAIRSTWPSVAEHRVLCIGWDTGLTLNFVARVSF